MIRERLPRGQYACATDMATRSRRAKQSTIVRNLTIAKEAAESLLDDDEDGISINVYNILTFTIERAESNQEDEASDVVARANNIQKEKKRKHGLQSRSRSATSSTSKTSSTNVRFIIIIIE